MTDPVGPNELRSALREVEQELERLQTEDADAIAETNGAGTLDSEERAAALTAHEENVAMQAALTARRDRLRAQLDED